MTTIDYKQHGCTMNPQIHRINRGEAMNSRSKSRCWKTPLMGCVLALLISPAFTVAAEAEDGVQWSEWKAVGNGYLSRRKQPPKLESPIAERQLANVQESLPNLKQLQKRLQKDLRKHKDVLDSGKQGSISGWRHVRRVARVNMDRFPSTFSSEWSEQQGCCLGPLVLQSAQEQHGWCSSHLVLQNSLE